MQLDPVIVTCTLLKNVAMSQYVAWQDGWYFKQQLRCKISPATHLMQHHAWLQDLASNKVFLYMKGDPAAPQCGFSQMACRILDAYGVPPLSCPLRSSPCSSQYLCHYSLA